MPIEDLMWVEKYRPTKLGELVDQETVKERLEPLLEKKEQMPHLLFAGPPGCGKTTTAIIIARQVLGEHWRDYTLSLNASDERGIDVVRERIKTFARFTDRREGVPFRLAVLDECDEMCLDPETRVLVGNRNDLKEMTLRELYDANGKGTFNLPSFDQRGMRLEDDVGRIVPSGKADLYLITFTDGRTVRASADHPFFIIRGGTSRMVRTASLKAGTEVAELSDKVLRCYNCSRPFFRQNPWAGYVRHFCSTACRNTFFGSLSVNRTLDERHQISQKAILAMRLRGSHQAQAYRAKRSAIAKRLVAEGRIPDPRTWRKFAKGEGAWVGKKLSEGHKKAISEGDREYFSNHPEVRLRIKERTQLSLLDPNGPYQKLVRSGHFKKANIHTSEASLASWKAKGFRSKTELKFAALLKSWGIEFERERVIMSAPSGKKYPFAIDFVVGRTAIFINGCWWHVCPTCGISAKYEKQKKNMEKDERHYSYLQSIGYNVVIVWEHELKDERSIKEEVVPKIFHAVGISGGHLPTIPHAQVKSVELLGPSDVLNISVSRNQNFVLANGILTHNTNDGQTALRRIMEENSEQTRFILICNYSSGIIEPLQSRCAIFRFQRIDEASVAEHLRTIAKKEKVKVASDGVFGAVYEATLGDLRQAINLLQAASASGEITVEAVKSVSGATMKARVAEILKLALDGDFEAARTKMVELTRVYGVPERDFLRFSNEALGSMKLEDMGTAVSILAEYDFRLVQGSQPELQLTAMLAQLSTLKRKGA